MKNNLVAVAVAAVVSLVVVGFLGKPVQNIISQPLGAVSVLNSPLEVNGAEVYLEGKALTTATTTVCAIKSPAATSTLTFAAVNFVVSSSTASTVTLAKATTAYATTTLLGVADIGANAQDTIIASSSPAAAEATIFAPSTYFVVGMAGGVGTFSPTGRCTATFTR